MEIVIDGYKNSERDVKTNISQGLPISSILFLIYINRLFDTITTTSPKVTFISFINDQGFMTSGNLIKEVTISLKTTGEMVLR